MGPCAGGAVYSPAITDFIIMVQDTSYMFVTGPDVVKTVTHEEVTFEELGGALTHAAKSGVAHFAAENEEDCPVHRPKLLSYLPQNNMEDPPFVPSDDPLRMDEALDSIVPDNPNKPYDMKDVIRHIVDDGDFLEVHEHWAQNIVVGFARMGGHSVGIVAQQPAWCWPACWTSPPAPRRALRALLRLLQHPHHHLGGRARLPARHWRRSTAASSATAPSCSTPTARPPCPRSRSSPARPTAAPTT
jgi:acetyl-CoA carboxylase carboxyltransferase component